jgi:hypothetical protein
VTQRPALFAVMKLTSVIVAIVFSKQMTICTMFTRNQHCNTLVTVSSHVTTVGKRDKMIGIDTTSILTFVMDMKVFRNRANIILVRVTMCLDVTKLRFYDSISMTICYTLPVPTRVI